MKMRWLRLILTGICLALLPCGCGPKDRGAPPAKADSAKEAGHGEADHEGHEEGEPPAGATFSEGRGLLLGEETKKALGVELIDVSEGDLQHQIAVPAQIYREASEKVRPKSHARAGHAYASAFVDTKSASGMRQGQPVKISSTKPASNEVEGRLVHIEKELDFYTGTTEILIEIPDPKNELKFGSQLQSVIGLGKKSAVVTVPSSALLRASEGNFVYVANGEHFLRTAVEVGATSEDRIEILSGLYAGDRVVLKPVESLWLTELRATKGGGHSH